MSKSIALPLLKEIVPALITSLLKLRLPSFWVVVSNVFLTSLLLMKPLEISIHPGEFSI